MSEKRTDSEIINEVVDSLGIFSISSFAEELGYSNASSIFHMMKNLGGRKINDTFIKRVLKRFPEVNEMFLRNKSDVPLNDTPTSISQSNLNKASYTLNDLPLIMLDSIKHQKKTNELLRELLDYFKNVEK